jgi:hypothetical protein
MDEVFRDDFKTLARLPAAIRPELMGAWVFQQCDQQKTILAAIGVKQIPVTAP